MDGEQLAAAVARLMGVGAGDLTCDEPGHPDGHTCLPISGGADVDGLIETLTKRYAGPFTHAASPSLRFAEQAGRTHAWVWDDRAVTLGRGPDGRPFIAVAERDIPRPEELPAEMSWVERLVAITAGTASPVPAPDWAAVESRLGAPLPGDYRRIVETFGCDGLFDAFFQVFTPDELIWHAEVHAGDDLAPGDEHPPFPAPSGVIPWSSNEHQETFFWITEGPDPDRWPVYAVDSLGDGSRFECTATEFLFRQMTDPDHPFFTRSDNLRGHWFMKFARSGA
ncbi:hypothetical protein [Actinomadura rugatobispora]|uniref:SMI1/KNR4 family protein n=1 Tax=Actinomadura rugatobispora TaxID=1994 RepID=A0ABW0ZWT9_9ACTN